MICQDVHLDKRKNGTNHDMGYARMPLLLCLLFPRRDTDQASRETGGGNHPGRAGRERILARLNGGAECFKPGWG